MKIEVEITHKLDGGVLEFIRGLFNEDGAAPVKTTRAAAGSRATAAAKPAEPLVPGADEETEEITIEAIREVLVEKKDAGKSEKIKALLATFDVKSATNLDKKDYAAFIIKLRKL